MALQFVRQWLDSHKIPLSDHEISLLMELLYACLVLQPQFTVGRLVATHESEVQERLRDGSPCEATKHR